MYDKLKESTGSMILGWALGLSIPVGVFAGMKTLTGRAFNSELALFTMLGYLFSAIILLIWYEETGPHFLKSVNWVAFLTGFFSPIPATVILVFFTLTLIARIVAKTVDLLAGIVRFIWIWMAKKPNS